jgi:hypothetical protein
MAASSAHAQLPPPPTVVVGPLGINNANVIACTPRSIIAGIGDTCTFTVLTPNVSDLACIRLVNLKRIEVVPVVPPLVMPQFPDCVPATPNSMVTITVNRPALGTGDILGNIGGLRANGQITQVSQFVLIPDVSTPLFTQLTACPIRQALVALGLLPSPDPLCAVVSNDITPGEYPEF